jgi:error-prone DNA polymerase
LSGANPSIKWREAREWWAFAPYLEFDAKIDAKGIRRETVTELPTLGVIEFNGGQPLSTVHNEDYSLREPKIRNEKFARANGALPDAYYARSAKERRPNRYSTVPPPIELPAIRTPKPSGPTYAPLHLRSGYAFGESTMLAEELGKLAGGLGLPYAAIADPMSLVGASEFAKACTREGVGPLIGAAIEMSTGGEIVLIAKSPKGYQSLSRLITACHLEEPRGFPLASWERLAEHATDLLCLTGGDRGILDRHLIRRDHDQARQYLERLISLFGRDDTVIEIERSYLPWQPAVETSLHALAQELSLMEVAAGAITHARPSHFPAQDTLVCVETLCLIEEVVGRKALRDVSQPQVLELPRRGLNAERYLRSQTEMAALYEDRPELLRNTLRVAERCEPNVLPPRSTLPQLFENDAEAFEAIVKMEAVHAYGVMSDRSQKRLEREIERIRRLGFASHFLVAWDMCRWAREQGIQQSGRGSVVDSAVAFVLGFSRIDAIRHDLHFDRFLPDDGSKRPDIDIDFEARRRDDVRGYLTWRYGVENVATVAAIGSYRSRGIVREVGKVMGIPQGAIGYLAKRIHGGIAPSQLEAALKERPELRDANIPKEKFRWVIELAERMMDIPRNLRCHSSGIVVSSRPLAETVPVMWAASESNEESKGTEAFLRVIQWDKRSAKHYFDKFDVLCLRGQDVLSKTERHILKSSPDFSIERLDATTDEEVYRAMRSGELIGIPQSASPAMRQAHMRLQTRDLHDASLVQAGIRPGVGGAVKMNELIARRRGKPYSYEHPDIEKILGISYGIIVFQEQVDQLLQTFCGFSSGEAEDLRDLIHSRRREDYGLTIKQSLIERIQRQGYDAKVAEAVCELVRGFKGYGFAQGHALAFAEVSLRSVSVMQNHPAPYFAALLSAQPAGYYGPATIANEARVRGIHILGIDVNRSEEEFSVESKVDSETGLSVPEAAIRVGLMQLHGLSTPTKKRILGASRIPVGSRQETVGLPSVPLSSRKVSVAYAGDEKKENLAETDEVAFTSFFDFVAKVRPKADELATLILCGAFDRLHPNRRTLLWAVPSAESYASTVVATLESGALPFDIPEPAMPAPVADFSRAEKAVYERTYLGLDVQEHLMAFERKRVAEKGGRPTADARRLTPGTKVMVVGNPIRLRFPPTASGKRVVFFDLEDETGLLNVTCFDDVYRRDGHAIVCSQYVTLLGETQDRDGHTAFLAHRVFTYRPQISKEVSTALPLVESDFLVG